MLTRNEMLSFLPWGRGHQGTLGDQQHQRDPVYKSAWGYKFHS